MTYHSDAMDPNEPEIREIQMTIIFITYTTKIVVLECQNHRVFDSMVFKGLLK